MNTTEQKPTEQKAGHTPGPWHIERHSGRYEIWPKDEGQPHSYVGVVQTKIDATLIAAAPELLEVLTRIANNAAGRKWNGESSGPDFEAFSEIERAARAAIAKATGA